MEKWSVLPSIHSDSAPYESTYFADVFNSYKLLRSVIVFSRTVILYNKQQTVQFTNGVYKLNTRKILLSRVFLSFFFNINFYIKIQSISWFIAFLLQILAFQSCKLCLF